MNQSSFEIMLKDRIKKIDDTLGKKAAEYARGDDRLHNFKRVAAVKKCSTEQACIDGFCKHLVSILDMVDDISVYKKHSMELWDEKIGDAINYLILLEAIIKESFYERKSNLS